MIRAILSMARRRRESRHRLLEMAATWGAMSEKERARTLKYLAASDLPKGCTVEVPPRLGRVVGGGK